MERIVIDFQALDDWVYTDRTLDHLPLYDRDGKRFVEVLSAKAGRTMSIVIEIDELEEHRDFESMTFDGFRRRLGPWDCYLNRVEDGWQWEIISHDRDFQPLWDMSQQVYPWQSIAAEALFDRYPHLYSYTKEGKKK